MTMDDDDNNDDDDDEEDKDDGKSTINCTGDYDKDGGE